MNEQSSYPLSWPKNRPRTQRREDSRFGDHSMRSGTDELVNQLRMLSVQRFVLSSNVPLRRDGFPVSDYGNPEDPGVAVYFDLKGRPTVLACDRWRCVEDNLWAITKHMAAVRGTTRWGVGEVTQAFAGYTALPPPADLRPWYEVLGVRENCTLEQAKAAWLKGAKLFHPDAGGSHEAMSAINGAWARAQELCNGR